MNSTNVCGKVVQLGEKPALRKDFRCNLGVRKTVERCRAINPTKRGGDVYVP
jgi:hypothetical protein